MSTVSNGPPSADHARVRPTNLGVVLRHVRAAGPCSRADIAASTGLNKATVSSLVAALIERRILREIGLTEHRIGRPATMLIIDGHDYVGIGAEVGVDQLTVVGLDLGGRQVLNWRRSLPAAGVNAGRIVAELAGVTRRAAARVRADGGTVVGLTVAVPGLVDSAGVVRSAPALGWKDVELRAALTWALANPAYPIVVDSDATLGALAEQRYGSHAGSRHLAYLAGSPGGGIGVISGGVPIRGVHGYGGALGHVRVDPGGPACACGRIGCLDAVAGLDALLRRTGSDPREVDARDVEVEQLARRADMGEEVALTGLAEAGTWLGCAVALLVDLLHPTVVLLGGYYARLAPWLIPAVVREFQALAVTPDAGALQVAASILGYEAAALGGAAVALDGIESAGAALSLLP